MVAFWSRTGYAGRHCIFVNHTHTHTLTHICSSHLWRIFIWFIFIPTIFVVVFVVLLVFSTDIIFFALFCVVFTFCFVYFPSSFCWVATSHSQPAPTPSDALPCCIRLFGCYENGRPAEWLKGRTDVRTDRELDRQIDG